MTKITLTPDNPTTKILLNEGNPLFKIKRFRFEPDDAIEHHDAYSKINLKYIKRVRPQLRLKNGGLPGNHALSAEISPNQKNTSTDVNWVLNSVEEHNYDQIELILENSGEEEISLELWYETQEIHPFTVASQGFKEHIDQNGNTKILFSAPFGTGKTTFLREYFKENNEYEVFHLFPVNYSVASNEDIFKYIKVELLFSLLERDVEFDMESFSKSMTLPFYIGKQAHELLLPFVKLLPKVGKSVHAIINDLLKLVKDFESYHGTSQIDDKDAAEDFIKEVYEKEGSLFEDNFYTQMIRQLIEQTQAKGKKTVLILDDLDRIDPEHIFRILNVFAAHVDRQGMPDEMTNKFGFDRIILVCHYENLKKIFQHKYGPDTDFSGYVDKYFSRSKFKFISKEIAYIFASQMIKSENKYQSMQLYSFILRNLIDDEIISIRELIKLFGSYSERLLSDSYLMSFDVISFLCEVMDIDSLINRFSVLKENKLYIDDKYNYDQDYFFGLFLSTLLFYNESRHDTYNHDYYYERRKLTVNVNSSYFPTRGIIPTIKTDKDSQGLDIKFSREDCFEILHLIALEYKKINGLKSPQYK
jgi:DNA polymerase III delta prime subunit